MGDLGVLYCANLSRRSHRLPAVDVEVFVQIKAKQLRSLLELHWSVEQVAEAAHAFPHNDLGEQSGCQGCGHKRDHLAADPSYFEPDFRDTGALCGPPRD